jgi:hypothetical protein
MDIFCDKSGCTSSIASAISLLFEELVSEQYGRRSLIRISGLSERATGDETTTAVRKIMSEIDPDQNFLD